MRSKAKKRATQELGGCIYYKSSWEQATGSKSVRISNNKFTLQEFDLLRDTFKAKFNLDCTIQLLTTKGAGKATPKDKYSLYIKLSSLPRLRELVLPYMHSSMLYKLGIW
jgi:hypothetical protein